MLPHDTRMPETPRAPVNNGRVHALNLVLAGAPLDTGNRGVEALGRSVLDAIDGCEGTRRRSGSYVALLDNGWGIRPLGSERYSEVRVERVGVRLSRRWHRPESWAQVHVAQLLGARLNPVARRIASADAVLDISGGDSFTDLYGPARLAAVSAPKRAAERAGTPLVLLPQTYGPFDTKQGRQRAGELIRGAALAYARDPLSHLRLLELAGRDADVSRCRQGVDVAFALRPRPAPMAPDVAEMLNRGGATVVGVNVSGLLVRDDAGERFGLIGDYLATMTTLAQQLIAAGAFVVFVPHVHHANGQGESDVIAITAVRDRLTPGQRERTVVLPPELDAAELKWCMSHLEWMVGSRMHSTIGALSQLVPTFGYAYSDKTAGVFETCEVGDEVVDARQVGGDEAVESMIAAFARRRATAATLARTVPPVVERSRDQLSAIVTAIESWRGGVVAGTIG